MSILGRSIVLCIFILAVSASVTEKILKIPLLEVGEIWINSVFRLSNRLINITQTVFDVHSYTFYIAVPVAVFLLYHLYHLLFTPLNRIRVLGDLGYLPDGKFTKKEIANSVKQRRAVGNIPPVYPNGWFGLIEGWRLKKGQSVNLAMLGEQLAVFRDEKGQAHILDAYCPHMGANLAVGGRVIGDCLECPFHGWKFRGEDGKCTHIPYTDKVPEGAKVKSWPTTEINGWIYMWYHAEGVDPTWTLPEMEDITSGQWAYKGRSEHYINSHIEYFKTRAYFRKGLDPTWTLPEMEDITSGQWAYKGRSEHYINSHIEEIPENGADVAHLSQVHTPVIAAGIDLTSMWNKYLSFAWHTWTAQWKQNPAPEEHIGSLTLTHDLQVFGFSTKLLFMSVKARQIGPGVVYLTFDSVFGKGVYIQSLVPVEPMVQKLVHNLYMTWTVPTFIAKFFLLGEAIQVERDVMIWNNKKYESKPFFVKSAEDTLIAKHRRWYSQFYSENSPRLTFRKEGLDW